MSARGTVTSVGLILLAVGAVTYAYVLDRGTISDADRASRRDDVLPSFRVEDVTRVRLEHGAESLVFERVADGGIAGARWRMTSPRREAADGAAVDVLLRELEDAKRLRSVDGDAAVALEPPRVRGVLEVGPVTYRFALGGNAPRPVGAAYLRVDGEGTFVVDGALAAELLRGADAYRDRAIVPGGAGGVARVRVQAASGATTTLERDGATFRRVAEGTEGTRASRAAVERLLSALADARAERFLDGASSDDATRAPAFTVTVTPRDEGDSPVELKVGGPCPDAPADVVVVRRAPSRLAACAPGALADALRAMPPPDPSPFFAHDDEMEEVRLEPVGIGGPAVDIARRGSGWHERSPEDHELAADESASADALVRALAQAEGSLRPASSGEGFQARARVTIVRTGTRTTEVVEVAAPLADGTALARRADDGAWLVLPRATARRFEPHPVALRGGSAWRPPFDAASVVAIDDTCGPTRRRLALVDHRWLSRAPAGAQVDPLAVTDLTVAAAQAKPDAWLTEADDGGFGFDAPGACTVSLALAPATGDGPPRRASLAFGASGDGGVYARTLDDPAVFVVPESLVRALSLTGSER